MNSGMFKFNWKDISKGLVMAVLSGILLPIATIIQSPGFDITQLDWHQVLLLSLNGSIVGFVGYVIKNFFSDSSGSFMGKIG